MHHPSPAPTAPITGSPTLTWANNRFVRAGRPVQIIAGSMHYFRVHPRQWRDRMTRLVDLGMNTVDTYIAWNFHQPHLDAPADFTHWRDVSAFLEAAADAGLDAIVRPGPYICAEWSNGGLPVWLTREVSALRTANPEYLGPVEKWFDTLIPLLAAHQANRGGNVVAVQVENEFGSFGDDEGAVTSIARLLEDRGITELLYTADGPTDLMLDTGTSPGLLAAINLGSKPEAARTLIRERRPEEPFFVAEYWNGWFDHWGHPHHVRGSANAAATLADIVADGGSVSIYMAHGGSNFGLWAGANRVEGELRATTTSYDSDAPIAEDGTLTEKFHAMRRALGVTQPVRSTPPVFLAPASLPMTAGIDLTAALAAGARPPVPVDARSTAEDLGADAGLISYRAEVALPARAVELVFEGVADRALVFIDGRPVGSVAERGTLTVQGEGKRVELTVLVEDLGRVNYGPNVGERKGLVGPVLVERRIIQHWQAEIFDPRELDADALSRLAPSTTAGATGGAGLAFTTLDIEQPRDAHLALPGFTKGFVWVNGFLLGRYWNIGPQATLYVPAPLLRSGENAIVVLELESRGDTVEIRTSPELGPEEEYVEEF